MNAIQFIAPILGGLCFANFAEKKGDFCNFRQNPKPVIKYYESKKSCYVNGIFYTKCEERFNGIK